jgi:ketosteroid isomerase-like protein
MTQASENRLHDNGARENAAHKKAAHENGRHENGRHEILALEHGFWRAMRDDDVDAAVEMLDDESAVASAMGIHHFDPAGYRKMAEDGPMRLTGFEFADEQVFFPVPDVAIVTYAVRQTFEIDGQAQTMNAHDTTTWVRKNGRWVAVLHTESPRQADA